jgi:hypothetical protein
MAKLSSVKRDLEKHVFKNLSNQGEHVLECSACGAPLVNIMVTDATGPVETLYAARCPHCGDRSFNKRIKGNIIVGRTDYTFWVDCGPEQSSDGELVTMFETKVLKPYA